MLSTKMISQSVLRKRVVPKIGDIREVGTKWEPHRKVGTMTVNESRERMPKEMTVDIRN